MWGRLISECACNTVHSRSKMVELLFETHRVPSIAFGVAAAFSSKYNHKLDVCDRDGLAICSGFTTSHVIPVCNLPLCFMYVILFVICRLFWCSSTVCIKFTDGEPVYEVCCHYQCGWLPCHR